MSGTKVGGQKSSATNKRRYGADFFKTIGKLGGQAGRKGKGFAADPERARRAGRIGGKNSRRKAYVSLEKQQLNYEVIG